jgi:uncharacterized protein (TIGR02118 family)
MVKLVALYRKPTDPEAFERAYFVELIPLVKKIPGLQRVNMNRITGAPRGEPDFCVMTVLCFNDRDTMDRSLASPENIEAGKNLTSFARGLVSFVYAEEMPT